MGWKMTEMGTFSPVLCRYFPLLIVLCLLMFYSAYGHGHGHSHGDESPSFKYSRQANEPRQHQDHGHSHDHGHAHDHGHGHSHDHGHAHDHGHGHSHDHGHAHDGGHGHSHNHGNVRTQEDHSHTHDDDHKYHHDHEDEHTQEAGRDHEHVQRVKREDETVTKKSASANLWLTALGSTLLISAAPVVILFFIPLDKSPGHQPRLKVLLSFASGGLLGDAFLHLIPHAISPHGPSTEEHTHSHSHGGGDGHSHSHDMRVGLWVLTGIVAFLAVEKLVRFAKGADGHGHSHGVSHEKSEGKKDDTDKKKQSEGIAPKSKKEEKEKETTQKSSKEVAEKEKNEGIKVAGYLNLVADFMHNFTDGLAIGASYLAGDKIGIITTVTILLHEVPHEIGDFAILVQSGCSKKKAMLLQLTTAVGAMVGTLCSLMAEGAGDLATAWILPFTAGGFIYIATVSVIPELLEDSKIWQSIKEITALLVGIFMMILIAEYE